MFKWRPLRLIRDLIWRLRHNSQVDWTHLCTLSIPSACYKFRSPWNILLWPLPNQSKRNRMPSLLPLTSTSKVANTPACFFPNLPPPQNSNPVPHPSNAQRQIRQYHECSIQVRGIAFGDFGSCCFSLVDCARSSIMARARDGRPGFKISVKFRRNFGIFFVFGSYREVEFR